MRSFKKKVFYQVEAGDSMEQILCHHFFSFEEKLTGYLSVKIYLLNIFLHMHFDGL